MIDDPKKYKIKKVFIHPILLLKADKFLIRITIKHRDCQALQNSLRDCKLVISVGGEFQARTNEFRNLKPYWVVLTEALKRLPEHDWRVAQG